MSWVIREEEQAVAHDQECAYKSEFAQHHQDWTKGGFFGDGTKVNQLRVMVTFGVG